MKAYIYTEKYLDDLLKHLTVIDYTTASFKQTLIDMNKTLIDYLYETLTSCVEEYEPLALSQDFPGEYDHVCTVFDIPARTLNGANLNDIRVVELPLDQYRMDRLSLLIIHIAQYDNPPVDNLQGFVFTTEKFVKALEAQYLSGPTDKELKYLMFSRYASTLCVLTH